MVARARFRRLGVHVLAAAGLVAVMLPNAQAAAAAARPAPGGVPPGLLAAARARGLSPGPAKLTGTHTARHDQFGTSVAISGTTAVIGAYEHVDRVGIGAAYVFTEQGGVWHQQAVLVPDQPLEDFFGWSVAISGSVIAVGSPVLEELGQVYVFTRTGTRWSQTARFQAADGVSGDQFGAALALSGTTMVVGAPGGNWTNNKAYVFSEQHGQWAQTAELTASNGLTYDNFGRSVALSGDTVIVGAPGKLGQYGAAYVYTGSGGRWAQQAELTATGGLGGDQFGAAVAVLGTTALIGAPHRDSFLGAAYVFTQVNGTWLQQAELPSPIASPASFGSAIAMERGTAVITSLAGPEGAAFVYRGSGASWTEAGQLAAPVGPNGYFWSAAMSGSTAILGAPSLKHFTGAAYVFRRV
jgi:hypothetical protein